MTSASYQRRLHWFAVSTVFVLMTTLAAGALVTSKNAGLAFRDWPTSDGQAMFSYPWLQDFARDFKKFIEHGHRLSATMTGCWAIGLAAAFNSWEVRGWVRTLAVAFLCAVIVQGLLGGFRVELESRGLAMVHGFFAACVTAILATLVTVESRGWFRAADEPVHADLGWALPLAIVTLVLITAQYLLGGAIRHHHTGLHEHLALGLISLVAAAVNMLAARRTGVAWLQATGTGLLIVVVLQVVLGGATWVSKWGFAPWGFTATVDSISQVAHRTSHMVLGVFVFASAVVHMVRVCRVASLTRSPDPQPLFASSLPQRGGAA